MNPNWIKWIVASINQHFTTSAGATYVQLQGFPEQTADKDEWYDLKTSGPDIRKRGPSDFLLTFEVNIAVNVKLDSSEIYNVHSLAGTIAQYFFSIPILKYGDGDAQIGCLAPATDVFVSHFGQPDPDKKILQSTVEARYEMKLTGDE